MPILTSVEKSERSFRSVDSALTLQSSLASTIYSSQYPQPSSSAITTPQSSGITLTLNNHSSQYPLPSSSSSPTKQSSRAARTRGHHSLQYPQQSSYPPTTPPSSRGSSSERSQKQDMVPTDEKAQSTHRFFHHELDASWMEAIIIACFFTSGLIDSVAFNSWNCFVGMQTGNTIFAALGLVGQPISSHSQQWYKGLVSIGSFLLGGLFFNALHARPTGLPNQPTSRQRWMLVISFAIQTLLVATAAILVSLDLVSNQPFIRGRFSSGTRGQEFGSPNYLDMLPVSLLAFASPGQVCLSRVLSLPEFPTIVISTLYHNVSAEAYGMREAWRRRSSWADLVQTQWKHQEMRIAAIFALFIGGLVGGLIYRSSAGMGGALWMAVGLKGAMSLSFLAWKRAEETLPI